MAYKIFSKFPFELKKVAANSIDAAQKLIRFHYFLNHTADKAVYALQELSKKQARQFSKINKGLSTGKLPWNIAILIDATFLNRSSLRTDNSKRFNHGKGFVHNSEQNSIKEKENTSHAMI